MPKISVIIPSYNHELYVKNSIESVLNQTYQDFEIIIYDDASSDNTVKEIKKIRDKRIKLISSHKNRGVSAGINECLKHTTGKYIAHLNSDDRFLKQKLKKQMNYLDTHSDVGAVFSYAELINEQGKTLNEGLEYHSTMNLQQNKTRYEWLKYFFYKCRWLWHPSMMIRKKVYQIIGNHDQRLAQIHDYDLGIRLSLQYNIHIIQEPLVQFRIREGNMNASANTIQSQVRSMFEFGHVLKRFLKIKTTQEFLKIFPEQKKYNDIIDDSLIPFYVARLALEVKHVFHQKFALDTWFDLFTNKTLVQKMERICHFNYTDFIQYTGIHDIYHVQHVDFQNEKIKTLTQEIERLISIQSFIRSLFKKCNLALKMK